MDAYQQQQSHIYAGPPPPQPPYTENPQHQFPPPPPRPPISQQPPYYSGQFQFQPPPAYPPPQHNPYPAHHHQQHFQNQFPIYPPPPPSYPPPPQQGNQELSNPNWGQPQGLNYQVHSNEEDWAARAREWATAKSSMDHQNPQSQSSPLTRAEEQAHHQYPQTVVSHYSHTQQPYPSSNYQQQESASVSSGPASYAPNGNFSYTARDDTSAGESNAAFSYRENLSESPTFHQQEVPSSYSSVTGKGGAGGPAETSYNSLHFPVTSHQEGQFHVRPPMPDIGRSDLMEQPHAYRNYSAHHLTDIRDQPLDFAPGFNRVNEPQMQSSFPQHGTAEHIRGMGPVAAVPSVHAWAPPVAPGIVYPSNNPSGLQHDPSMAGSSSTQLLGRMPGPGFQPPITSGSAPFGLGAVSTFHSMTAFPGDPYGVPNSSDRPKKQAVPNWLREEIIKKKTLIPSAAQDHSKEDTQSIEDDGVEKSFGKGDQADSKNTDSPKSIEDEDDDEDYVEAARTAAINQEIKRILTEVLLKVTDELFDEIATKVLNEDDLIVEVNQGTLTSNNRTTLSPPAVSTPTPSAKLLTTVKSVESDAKDTTEKSNLTAPGDLLGLGSYASDDEDDEIQTPNLSNSSENNVHQQSYIKRRPEDLHGAGENGTSSIATEEQHKYEENIEDIPNKRSPSRVNNIIAVRNEMGENNDVHAKSSEVMYEVKGDVTKVDGKTIDGVNDFEVKYEVTEENASKSESRETITKLEKDGKYETKRSSVGKDSNKEVENSKHRIDGKRGERFVKQDESSTRKEKTDEKFNGSKGKRKEEGHSKKTKETDLKKHGHHDVQDDRSELERGKKASVKEDNEGKREREKDENEDRLRHNSSRHKKRYSPSLGTRDRNGKVISSVSHANDSSEETSEDSRRKLRSKRRNLSPSPVKSKRRQLSRSPHLKHSQRRHSPYSSLERTRKRRSRSRSPIRRQR